ncbi:hypothetical protein ACVNF4_09160 [Streptomyces sp. S6]
MIAITIGYQKGVTWKSYGKDPRSAPDRYCAPDTRGDLVGFTFYYQALYRTKKLAFSAEGTDIRGAEGRGHSL